MSAADRTRPEPVADPAVRARTGTLRVGIGLLLGTLAWATPFATGSAVLLPARIEAAAPDDKVRLLAILTATAATVGLIANVLFGALSDGTRSRFGARSPWILGGGLATALVMAGLSRQESFPSLVLWWALVTVVLNAMTATLSAVLPDRVPAHRRATVSAVIGMGILLGHATGTVFGAAFLTRPSSGLLIAGVASALLATLAVLVAPDLPSTRVSRAQSWTIGFPRGAPDFYWALWGRLLLVLGYFMINSYQLYILTDHVGLSRDRAAHVLGINSVLFLVAALVAAALSGPLSDRTGRRKPFVIGSSLAALIAIAIPLVSATATGMMAFACVGGLAFGCYYAVDAALMAEVLPSGESRAKDLGILNVANTVGQALAPAASSFLVGLGSGYGPAFAGAMVACAAGAVLVVPIRTVQ